MADAGLIIESIGGNAPVQAEGTIDGVPFYFRARHQNWTLYAGPDPFADDAWMHRERYSGEDDPHAASWISEEEARAFIARAAAIWRQRPT